MCDHRQLNCSDLTQKASRNDNDFSIRYPGIAKALVAMPDEIVLDGEVVALDESGKPSFNTLQNYGSGARLHYYVFDLLVMAGRNVTDEPLTKRRELLEAYVLPKLDEPIRYSPALEARLKDLIQSVKAQRLEGLVAKRRDSRYEPASVPVPGRRCVSTGDRNSSSRATRRRQDIADLDPRRLTLCALGALLTRSAS
jgi:ATP-dependent DNA ligase